MEKFDLTYQNAVKEFNKNKEIFRYGQVMFNEFFSAFPKEVNTLRGTENDCFYDDSKVEKFLQSLYNICEKHN